MINEWERPGDRPEIAAVEGSIATEVQYSVRPLADSGLLAVHFRVRRLVLWGQWEPMTEPSFYTYDAACRSLGKLLHDKKARLFDPVVRESAITPD